MLNFSNFANIRKESWFKSKRKGKSSNIYLVRLSSDCRFDQTRETRSAAVSAAPRQAANIRDLTSGDSSDPIVLQTLWQRYAKYQATGRIWNKDGSFRQSKIIRFDWFEIKYTDGTERIIVELWYLWCITVLIDALNFEDEREYDRWLLRGN